MQNPSTYDGFDFVILHPNELPEAFQFIEPGLQKIQEKAKLSWDVMVLPQSVSLNQATLTMIHYEGKYAGFVISSSKFFGMPNKHYLELTATYIEPWCHVQGLDGLKAINEWSTDFGNSLGCYAVIVTGAREGWAKRLSKLGFSFLEVSVIRRL
jgi:hypothetical protein